MQRETTKLRQFLLGNSAETEGEEIGRRIISDRDFDDEMSFAEEELIEDFLENTLTAEEKELFYRNFLTSPARIELLKETTRLRNYARNHFVKVSETAREEKKSGGFFENLKAFLTLNLRPIAAVLIILMLAGVAWRVFVYEAGGLTQIEKEYAALNAKDLSNPSETAHLSSKSLLSGTFRDAGGSVKLNPANLTENVLFSLALPPATPKDALFDLELTKGGQAVFKQNKLRVYQNQSGQELKVILPRSVLSKGSYQIKLNSGANYGFAVE
jgi:hypothetical protein